MTKIDKSCACVDADDDNYHHRSPKTQNVLSWEESRCFTHQEAWVQCRTASQSGWFYHQCSVCSNTHQRPHFPICCSYKRRTRHKRGTRRGSEIDGTRRITGWAAFRVPSGGSVLSHYGVIVEWRAQEGCEKNIFRCERVNVPIIFTSSSTAFWAYSMLRGSIRAIQSAEPIFERQRIRSASQTSSIWPSGSFYFELYRFTLLYRITMPSGTVFHTRGVLSIARVPTVARNSY